MKLFSNSLIHTFILAMFCCIALHAQEQKVGLVLSGGGAKGIAHVGVLKALEKAGIRPDYITGTSMGAVVGGLYSVGYSADEVEEMIREIDWNQILSNQVPLNYISFEEKEYYNRYLAEFPFEGYKLKLPSGLIEGQVLTETLEHFCWPANQYDSFDELPIPFRCMATDVATAESVVMKDGSLAMAIRSSMALPTAFTAVPYKNTLLVDGGVLNNFPVEEVKKMGADIVIGVNVSTGIDNTEMPESMLGILVNLATIPADKRVYEQIEQCDIYIQPDLGPYTTSSFSDYEEIIAIGDSAGDQFLGEFEKLSSELNRAYVDPQLPLLEEVRISEIELNGNRLFSDKLVLSKLRVDRDSIVTKKQLQQGVRRVFSINGFDKVNYQLIPQASGAYKLKVDMHEKNSTRLFTSVHVSNQFAAGIVLNLTARNWLGKESRTIIAGDISRTPAFRFDHYKYFGEEKKLALNLRYDYASEELAFYEKGRETDIRIDNFHRVRLGALTTQSLKQSFFGGLTFEYRTIKSRFSVAFPEAISSIRERHLLGGFGYTYNTLNDRNFPTDGSEIYLAAEGIFDNQFRVLLSEDDDQEQEILDNIVDEVTPGFYTQFLLKAQSYRTLGPKTQIKPYGALGFTIASADTGLFLRPFQLGGYQRRFIEDIRAYGLNYSEINEVNVGVLGLELQQVVLNNIFIRLGGNLYSSYPYLAISKLDQFDFDVLDNAMGFGYGAELRIRTRLGPIAGGLSTNTVDGYLRYYFALGFSFNYSD